MHDALHRSPMARPLPEAFSRASRRQLENEMVFYCLHVDDDLHFGFWLYRAYAPSLVITGIRGDRNL